MLTSFQKPLVDDPELVRERAQTTVSSLLALAGVEGEPLKSREHILLTTILLSAWQAGDSPDLAMLIQRIQQPPMTRIGVIDLESVLPGEGPLRAGDDHQRPASRRPASRCGRRASRWTSPRSCARRHGKPRVSIFSIAHLDDTQRMFFVSLLLNAVAGWMRTQGGTTSLRALVYMDEIFGYFPPTANPPSKRPLLTLLKQGRAAGVGVVLATQNPVDLDYKGLSNIGTWWLGRLQTERDKARAASTASRAPATGRLRSRRTRPPAVEPHQPRLPDAQRARRRPHTVPVAMGAVVPARSARARRDQAALRRTTRTGRGRRRRSCRGRLNRERSCPRCAKTRRCGCRLAAAATTRPVVPPDVPQFFSPDAPGGPVPLTPVVYAAANVRFLDPKLKLDATRLVAWTTPISDGAVAADWEAAEALDMAPELLERDAPEEATFAAVPAPALKAKNYDTWSKQFVTTLTTKEVLEVLRSPSTGETSRPDESERDFRARLQQVSREERDRKLDTLRRKYAPRQASLGEKKRRALAKVQRETEQASGQKLQTMISMGATLMGALMGRKAITASTLGRATTAARGMSRTMKESGDIAGAQKEVQVLEQQQQELEDELKLEMATLEAAGDPATETFERFEVKPKRTNVSVKLVALLWT